MPDWEMLAVIAVVGLIAVGAVAGPLPVQIICWVILLTGIWKLV